MCDRGILEKIRNNKIHENNKPKNRVLMDFIFYRYFYEIPEAEATRRRRRILQAGAFLFTEKLIPAPENAQDLRCEEDVWYQELLQFQ